MTVANIDADFGVSLPAVEPKGRVLVVLVLRSERKPHPPPMLGGHRRWLAGAAGGVNRPPGRVDEPPDFTSFLDVPVHHKSPERLVEPAAAHSHGQCHEIGDKHSLAGGFGELAIGHQGDASPSAGEDVHAPISPVRGTGLSIRYETADRRCCLP